MIHAKGRGHPPSLLLACSYTDIRTPFLSAFFKTPGNRRRLVVIVAVGCGTQLVGNGLVAYYLAPILKLIGITQPGQQAGINGGLAIFNLIVAVTAAQFVERLGRRPLWLAGNIGMLCAFIAITGLSVGFRFA